MGFIKLLKQLNCYDPKPCGLRDILITGDKIAGVSPLGEYDAIKPFADVLDCAGFTACPGFIDQHVHIIGGGGEDGPVSRIGEISPRDILLSGVTTLVGVLGFDSFTKSLHNLLAKANALDALYVSAYIYTGSYAIPTVTITDSIENDHILIDKVIGTGEVALSDARSSSPDFNDLANLCAKTHIAGKISGKAGIVHMHIGDGKEGIEPVKRLLRETELPKEMFVPTHMNRNSDLFNEAISYAKGGGNVDLTAGEAKGVCVPEALKRLIDGGGDLKKITVSSDANGSFGETVSKMQTLFDDIKKAILEQSIPPETALPFVTENVSRLLKLYPKKGALLPGSDADILVLDGEFKLQKLFCRGRQVMDNGEILKGVLP